MGRDLILIPVDQHGFSMTVMPASDKPILAHDKLTLDRDYEIFEAIDNVDKHKLLNEVEWYGDNGIETTRTDTYGASLMYAEAHDISSAIWHGTPYSHEPSFRNECIATWLAKMPFGSMIILWWC